MVVFTYSGLAAIILMKDLITDPVHIIGLLAPLIVLAGGDKIEAIVRNISGKAAK